MDEKQYQTITQLLKQLSATENHNQHEAWIAKQAAIKENPQKNHLTHNDLDILGVLLQGEKTVSEVVEAVQITQGGTSRRINHLEKLDLLEKFKRPTNKKTVYLKLTADGQKLATAHIALHKHLHEETVQALAEFSDSELAVVTRFLRKLADAQKDFETRY
ncbi:transcriptional regulator, MarR family [Pediococcus damnosus]|uniref:Transcriptional regulator, MarR family n=1 Tax=Pediococcus damnosus TaxID=51663 RepID=A0A143ASR8_9LACO|nr:MarR family transcriptional regulator [Pediococcus damnosus]AMV60345.1 transcriptional regulator, MarR family [Pediococcus damnosus]AMV62879.1 transcriptional regulator, MarR family [Pediococcus damnosus]AMV64595.1 transcriptional regulator, MarR family [Pediococcus damnosus]AMV67237.1 transcriptional regulator, MarR family [Pediococcus damnosus]KJU73954.1 ArsR family transcriptional regulator [Pediococcus damnosus LMG 28219]